MGPEKEFVEQAKLVHYVQYGWMDRIPSKVAQEVGMFFEDDYIHTLPGQKIAENHARRTAAHDATLRVESFRHGVRRSDYFWS